MKNKIKGKISIKYLILVIIGVIAFATIIATSSTLIQNVASDALGSAIN